MTQNDVAAREAQGSGSHIVPFPIAIWRGYRPYFVAFTVDFLVAVTLWVFLWAFHALAMLAKVAGWAGEAIVQVHATGIVIAFAVFGGLFIRDVWVLSRQREEG
jgi:hypothetical protein